MSEIPPNPSGSQPPVPPADDGQDGENPSVQQIRKHNVGARLRDDVAAGVFATSALVFTGSDEFVIDFVQILRPPHRVVRRVVMSPRTMGQFIQAVQTNLAKYEQSFGPPKPPPAPPKGHKPPSIEKIYEDLKLPDELLSGEYANVVMIGHSPSEFILDFATQFYPTAAVSSRVYVAASNLPRMLKSMQTTYEHWKNRPQGPPGGPPPTSADNPPRANDDSDGLYPDQNAN